VTFDGQQAVTPLPGPATAERVAAHPVAGVSRAALVIVLAWRLGIAVWGALAHRFASPLPRAHALTSQGWPQSFLSDLVDTGVRNDAFWYARIAQHGYFYSTTRPSSIGFYPLYPVAIHVVNLIVGNVYVAGEMVSILALVGAVMVFDLWLRDHALADRRTRSGILLLLFPFAMFYSFMYSESLYLFLVLLCFVAAERRWVATATVCAFLLVLTRPTGLVIVPCLILVAGWRNWRVWLIPATGAVAAIVAFSIYQWVTFGTPFAYVNAKAAPPWHATAAQALADLTLHGRPGIPPWFLAFNLAIGLAFAATVPFVWRRLGPGYAAFVGLSVLVSAYGTLTGMNRYVIVLFPVFALAASLRPRMLAIILPLMLITQALFVTLWVQGIGIF